MAFKVKVYSFQHLRDVVSQLFKEGIVSEDTHEYFMTYSSKTTPSYIVVEESSGGVHCYYDFEVRNLPAKWKYKSLRSNYPEGVVEESLISAGKSLRSSAGELFHTPLQQISIDDVESLLHNCKQWLQKKHQAENLEKYS